MCFEVCVRSQAQDRPNVVRQIPEELEPAGSVVAHRVARVVASAVLPMVETYVRRPAQFRNVPIQVPQEEFQVAAEDFIPLAGKVALAPVCLDVAGAEHPHKPLELETVKRKIESDRQQQPQFPQNELRQEYWHGRKAERKHQSQRGSISGVPQNFLAEPL